MRCTSRLSPGWLYRTRIKLCISARGSAPPARSRYARTEYVPESMPASRSSSVTTSRRTGWYTSTSARQSSGADGAGTSAARVGDDELELAPHAAGDRGRDRVLELIRRENALGTRDVVERECERDPQRRRIRRHEREVAPVGTDDPADLLDRLGDC